ncbi:hypothetical protein GCM10007392_40950 [Saccharospirillum salsuginis]|uniref:Uncharacterized protein n=1 Tax=Saccharospirillum salsuginis TaxID=418750 RepID=A0A918KP28_9GAMM|nr:hypothetical protein GCM10007392_40950 [Saccharospirillum salsuginis]
MEVWSVFAQFRSGLDVRQFYFYDRAAGHEDIVLAEDGDRLWLRDGRWHITRL